MKKSVGCAIAKAAVCFALGAVCLLSSAHAQESYPVRPVQLVVAEAPGGGTDILARVLAQQLSKEFGQQVIVVNQPGAAGRIGAEQVINAHQDGYTMGLMSSSYTTTAAMYKLPFDPINDITPVSMIGQAGWAVVVNQSVPAKTLGELITLAKGEPGVLNYGSTGIGGITNLVTELFDQTAGIKMKQVPYEGGGAALVGLLGGEVQVLFSGIPPVQTMVAGGKVRALAVTTMERVPMLPDVPTVNETVPGVQASLGDQPSLWWGLFGPKNLSPAIVAKWNQAVKTALATPEMKQQMQKNGVEPVGGTPAEFATLLANDIARWRRVATSAHLQIN